jgi:hypothetical protein
MQEQQLPKGNNMVRIKRVAAVSASVCGAVAKTPKIDALDTKVSRATVATSVVRPDDREFSTPPQVDTFEPNGRFFFVPISERNSDTTSSSFGGAETCDSRCASVASGAFKPETAPEPGQTWRSPSQPLEHVITQAGSQNTTTLQELNSWVSLE